MRDKPKISQRIYMRLRDFSPVIVAMLTGLLIIRLYEWSILLLDHGASIINTGIIFSGILLDFQFGLITALPLFCFYLLIHKLSPTYTRIAMSVLITFLIFLNALSINYFAITLTPLGPEFWAYSLSELTDTVSSSAVTNIISLSVLFAILIIVFWFSRIVQKVGLPEYGLILYLLIPIALFIGLFYFDSSRLFAKEQKYRFAENKLYYFISTSISQLEKIPEVDSGEISRGDVEAYPFMHPANRDDVISPFFRSTDSKPNIVFIIFESLGSDFIGSDAPWGGFTPYLDSLLKKSLYWENGLSMTGRTFGLMPSLFGSLPYGRYGFMELGPDFPSHLTLIRLLDENGYFTAYFSGFNTYFDKLDLFLEYQGMDLKVNSEVMADHLPNAIDAGRDYWGFDDQTMLRFAYTMVDTLKINPRLEIYHTLQSHSPFVTPEPERYRNKFQRILKSLDLNQNQIGRYRNYQNELTTLLYTDDAVRSFMESYRDHPDFGHTIFIITGDHRLIPVPQPNQISRYHVPIIIYSPMLKRTGHFKSVSTHADLVPTLISFLDNSYSFSFPDSVHWLGTGMDTTRSFRNIHSQPLMRNKNQLVDYIDREYYLSGDRLYRLEQGMKLASVNRPELKTRLKEKLNHFKKINTYVLNNDRLYPGNTARSLPEQYQFISEYDTLFARIDSLNMSTNQQFQLARQYAFDDRYQISRALCRRLLLEHPDFHDVRTLLGRTYAWEGRYEEARKHFYEVMRRDSTNYDIYQATYDTEMWAGNPGEALEIINTGLRFHPLDDQFMVRKIEALVRLNRPHEARSVLKRLSGTYPDEDRLKILDNRIESLMQNE